MKHARLLCLALCYCLYCVTPTIAQTELIVDASINDNRVKLLFDTGVEETCLFKSTADRLDLEVDAPDSSIKPAPGVVLAGFTEECKFSLGQSNKIMKLRVYEPPNWLDSSFDGLLAWSTIRNTIFHFSLEKQEFGILTQLPEDLSLWSKWEISPTRQLAIQIHKKDGHTGSILIDTGSSFGVHLDAKRWKEWRGTHPENPTTLTAYFSPANGFVVRKECWANHIDIGSFVIKDVPVMQASPNLKSSYDNREAKLGWFALSRFDIIVDGANNSFYTKPIAERTIVYTYNRIGAVFVPDDMRSMELKAHVVEGGPAYGAGIRAGDVLLSIDDLNVTKWRTDPNVLPLSRFWERPAGTSLNLRYARTGTIHKATVILRDILLSTN